MTDAVLEIRDISRSFGKVKAVDHLSFSLGRGEICGFIGPNGAGKTTTMRILATLDLPDSGDAFVDGQSVLVEPRTVRTKVGFMADQFVPYANLNVSEFLDFFARANGLTGITRARTVGSVAEFCGLGDFVDRPTTGLSKGMGQRLHLAKTLLHEPQVLILDEPAAGLDPRARIEFRELLVELAAAGKTILISSHILSELGETCDAIIVLEKGRMIVSGSIGDIARSVQHHPTRVRVLSSADEAQRFLLIQPHVTGVRIEGSWLHFDFAGDDEDAAQLLARALEHQLRVVEFRRESANLEEIFMHTTKGRLQ